MTGTSRAGASIRRRLTHDQTRALLLEYGAGVLFENGLTYGMEQVSLEDAVRETGVSRTSAYRIWSSDAQRSPQEAFKRDVLIHSIRNPGADDLAAMATLRDNLIDSVKAIASEALSPESAAEAVADVLMTNIVDQQAVVLYRSLQTAFAAQPDAGADPELLEALDSTEALWRGAMVDMVLEPMITTFGLKPRFDVPMETALEQASVAISSFLSGVRPKASLPTAGAIINKPLADGTTLRFGNVCLSALLMSFFTADSD